MWFQQINSAVQNQPILIAVAPNGARKTKDDHTGLPLSPRELIETAEACLEAGAGMMHFHVRDAGGRHSLDHRIYGPVLKELDRTVGDRMLLQVSSEAAGIYQRQTQMDEMKRLAPHCLSVGVREIISEEKDFESGHRFLSELFQAGALVQYILYSAGDVLWYERLVGDGVIPGKRHLLLFVVGRYGEGRSRERDLFPFVDSLSRNSPWMACGFGVSEHKIVEQAIRLGGHVRVGFENNHLLVDGRMAADNRSLVAGAVAKGRSFSRSPASKDFAVSLYEADEKKAR